MVVENLGCSIEDFKIVESIGRGGFGEVFKAECLLNGYEYHKFRKFFAIKKIDRKSGKKYGKKYAKDYKKRIDCEILIHKEAGGQPGHENIVKLYNHFKDKTYWYLVLEYCAQGSLKDYVAKEGKLPEKEACRLIKQLIDGVKFLHLKKIIHRDLSLRNVLLTDDCNIKIADFGLAYKLKDKTEKIETKQGTPDFMAPEVNKKEPYNFKPDWWSVGCILYAMLYGTPPFKHADEDTPMYKLSFPRHASKEAKTLLRDWLKENPDSRLDFSSKNSIKNVLNYDFFRKCESNKIGDSGINSPSSYEFSPSQSGQDTKGRNYYNSNQKESQMHTKKHQFDNGYHDVDVTKSKNGYDRSKEKPAVSFSSKHKKSHESSYLQSGQDTQKRIYYNLKEKHFERDLNVDYTTSTDPHDRSNQKQVVSLSSKQKKSHESLNLQSCQDTQRNYYNSNEKDFDSGLNVDFTRSSDPYDRSKDLQQVSLSSKQNKSHKSSHLQSGLDTQKINYNSNEKCCESGLNVDFTRSSDPHDRSKENQQVSLSSKQKKSSRMNRLKTEFELLPSLPKFDPVQSQQKYSVKNRGRAIVSSQRHTDASEGDTFNNSIGLNKTLTPLDARRLKSCRKTDEYQLRNTTYSILKNDESKKRQVCVEVSKKSKKYLYYALFISHDGKKITVFKPEKKEKILMSEMPPSLPQGIKSVSLENLPEKYRKNYEDAKKFVDSVRAGDSELDFPYVRPPVPTSCNDSFSKKTDSPEQSSNIKTRQSSLLSGGSVMKSFDAIMNTSCSSYQNSFQKNISTPLSCERGKDTVCKRIPETFPNFEFIRFGNKGVLCQSEDGIDMFILAGSKVTFSDRSSEKLDTKYFLKHYQRDICEMVERAQKNPNLL